MWKIFITVKNIFDYSFKDASDEFKEGFRKCFILFEIGYEKTILSRMKDEYGKMEEEHDKMSRTLAHERKTYANIVQKLKKENIILEEKLRRFTERTDGQEEMRMAG